MGKMSVVMSCEHGGNEIPAAYSALFNDANDVLNSHRGFDIGAIELFDAMKGVADYSLFSKISRLVIDLNRSLHRKTLFSEWTKPLGIELKQEILNQYYLPFRCEFESNISKFIKHHHMVLHLSIHSFTPILNEEVRNADVGILYHPGRLFEKRFASIWKKEIHRLLPELKVRFNYPYLGKPDGHVAVYRKLFGDHQYGGIEFELNQKHAFNVAINTKIADSLVNAIKLISL